MRSCADVLNSPAYYDPLLLLVIWATRTDDIHELLSIDLEIKSRHIKRRLVKCLRLYDEALAISAADPSCSILASRVE
jgi:hypothetical protein